MVDNSSHNSHKNPGKKISPFKKIFDNMKNFMKKDEEDNNPSSFEVSKTEKSPDSNILELEKSGKNDKSGKNEKRSMHEKKSSKKEQKLPKKYKKAGNRG